MSIKRSNVMAQRLADARARKGVVSTEGIVDKIKGVFTKDKTSYPDKLKAIRANLSNLSEGAESGKTVKISATVSEGEFYSLFITELTDYLKYFTGAKCTEYLGKIGAIAQSVERSNEDPQTVYRELIEVLNVQGLKVTKAAFPNLKQQGNSYTTTYKVLPNLVAWSNNRPELNDSPCNVKMQLPAITKEIASKLLVALEKFMKENEDPQCNVDLTLVDDEIAESFTSPLYRLGDAGIYQELITSIIDVMYKAIPKNTVSTEDGDVNVTIQQENEIETNDELAEVEPSDQNANPDAYDPTQAKADESDANLDAAISDVDQAADQADKQNQMDEIAGAVQGLESIQLLVNRVRDQRMAVSPLSLEAIQLSIDIATHKLPKSKVSVPSTESLAFGHRDAFQGLSTDLTKLTQSLRTQHTALKLDNYSQESIVGWVGNKWSDMFIKVWDLGHYGQIVHKVANILSRIEQEVKPLMGLSVDRAFISDPHTIWHLRGVTAANQTDAIARVHTVIGEIESFYKSRMVNAENAADQAINQLIEGQDFDIVIRNFQESLVNISLFDGRDIKLTGSTMYQGLRRVFGKSFKPGGGKRVDGIKTDWSNERGIAILNGEAIVDICKATKDMITQITPVIAQEKNRRQDMSAMIRLKFDEAIKASAAADLGPNVAIAKNLDRAKEILEYVNGIESIVLRSLSDNLYYLVYYLYASMTALEYIKDPFKAVREAEEAAREEAEWEQLMMEQRHERELRELRRELEVAKQQGPVVGDDDEGKPKSKGEDYRIVITY